MRTRFASQSERAGTELLLKAGYLVALLLVVVPLSDNVVRTWPIRPGDERWRFGTLGILFNALVTPLLGVFLALIVAAVLQQARTLRTLAVLTLVAAALVLGAIPLFGLDYLQLRAKVTAEAMGGFDSSARKAIVVGLLSATVALIVGITGWRAAGRIRPGRKGSDNVGFVLTLEEKAP
jgi:hypothetical protein